MNVDVEGGADRIKAVIAVFDKKKNAADAAGVSVQQLGRYTKGGEPGFYKIAGLALNAGVSLEWIATGNGEMLLKDGSGDIGQKCDVNHQIDVETLGLAIETTEAGLASIGKTLTPPKKAELVKRVYSVFADYSASEKVKQGNVIDLFKTIQKFA